MPDLPVAPGPRPLTAAAAKERATFSLYRKTARTLISDTTFPPGTVYQTPEGLRAEDEPTRAAFDVQGGVYPIRESVFAATYVSDDGSQRDTEPLREALNVERLATAMVKVVREQAGEPDGEGWPGYVDVAGPRTTYVTLVVSELAEGIAAEYAALGEEPHGQ